MEHLDLETCKYCGKTRDKKELKEGKIIRQAFSGLKTERFLFCADDNCAGCYQMGCEG